MRFRPSPVRYLYRNYLMQKLAVKPVLAWDRKVTDEGKVTY